MEFVVSAQEAPFSCLIGECGEPIDTIALNNIHRYQPITSISLGNIGLPQYNLIPKFDSVFKFKTLSFIGDEFAPVTHYDVKKPFTSVSYVLGSKSEQILSVLHTQNITPRTNFSVSVNKIKSTGFYVNQLTNNNKVASNFWHKSKNDFYKLDITFNHIRIFNDLNGGVTNDSSFTEDLLLNRNRQLMPVNLTYASTTVKKSKLELDQQFSIFKKLDTLEQGSSLFAGIKLYATEIDKRFKDSLLNTDYYSVILIDSVKTNDKNYYRGAGGKAYVDYSYKTKSLKVNISPYFNYETKHVLNDSLDTIISNSSIGVNANLKWKKHLFKGSFEQWINGYRSKDYLASLSWGVNVKDFKLKLDAKLSSYHPSWDLLFYKGNNIQWVNVFTQSQLRYINGSVEYLKSHTTLSYSYTEVNKAIVFNTYAQPQQSAGVSQFMQTTLAQNINIKKFHIDLSGTYQFLGGYQVLQLPNFVATSQMYFMGTAFKKNLNYRMGLEGVYYSEFNAMGFSPMAYAYHLDQQQKIGNYAQVNAFFNFRIKSVRLFLKATHLNAGLMGYRYYGAYNYPLKDRSFQFGLNWNFVN